MRRQRKKHHKDVWGSHDVVEERSDVRSCIWRKEWWSWSIDDEKTMENRSTKIEISRKKK